MNDSGKFFGRKFLLEYHVASLNVDSLQEILSKQGYTVIEGFEKKLSSLTAVTGYSDAIGLQFSSKTYSILLPSAPSAQRTLALLKP